MKEVYKDEAGQWRFRVKGRNGEKIASGEGYTRPEDAERALDTLTLILVGLAGAEPIRRG